MLHGGFAVPTASSTRRNVLTLSPLLPVRTGRPGCRDGPMLVVGRPRVLDIMYATLVFIADCEDVPGNLAGRG